MDVFKKMWPDAWGVRMEHILRNVLMALLEQPDATLHEVLRVLSDKAFRQRIGKSLRNETVRTFLLYEFDQFSFGYRADATAPIQNKVGAFLADPLLNRILTAPEKDLRIRHIMDRGQVLLVNLAKGRIGDDSSSLLSGLLATAIGLAAHSRADMPEAKRRDFFVYIDEFQSFTTLAMAGMLSELLSTGSASRSPTSTFTSWSPISGTPSSATLAPLFHFAPARRTRHTSSASSTNDLLRRISCNSPITGSTSSS